MIKNKNKAKATTEHVSCHCNSLVQYIIRIKNGIIKHVNVNVKIVVRAKGIIV